MEYRKCLVKSDKEVINMVYLKYTSKYVCFMLHVYDNLADFHTSCFLFKSFSSFPYLSRQAEISVRAEISPCNQPLRACSNFFGEEIGCRECNSVGQVNYIAAIRSSK